MPCSTLVRSWRRILISLGVLILAGPLTVSNVYHLFTRGHLGLGLHSDVMTYDSHNGRYHSVWALNLTPFPVPVRVCIEPSDGGGPDISYRHRAERRTDASARWETPGWRVSQCSELGRVEWEVWWPGTSARLVHDAGYRARVQGDRLRFVAFTLFDRPDDHWLQFRVLSDEIILTGNGERR